MRSLAAALVLVLGLPSLSQAQTGGLITGRVTDALNGRPLAGAEVAIDAGRQGALTDGDGRYVIRDVLAGYRQVSVRAVGFKPLVRDSVLVGGGRTAVIGWPICRFARADRPVPGTLDRSPAGYPWRAPG